MNHKTKIINKFSVNLNSYSVCILINNWYKLYNSKLVNISVDNKHVSEINCKKYFCKSKFTEHVLRRNYNINFDIKMK